MGYIEQNLAKGEHVIQRAHLHWVIFLWPCFWAFFAIAQLASSQPVVPMVLFFAFIAVFMWTMALLNYYTSEFALTDRRIIAKTGIISRKSAELLMSKVESIQVDQPVIGRLLGYGTVTVVGTGGGRTPFRRIADPMTFRAAAQSIMDNATSHPHPTHQAAPA